MSVTGKIVSTTPDWRGDTLTVDALATDTVLIVNDAVDFNDAEGGGGWLVIADETTPREYVDCDYDLQTVTLAAALGVAIEADMPVITWDPDATGEHRVVEHVAIVTLDGDGGSCQAVMDHSLIPTAGINNLIGASVEIDDDGDEVWVVSVDGRQPVLDGGYIDRDTLPDNSGPDGLPPASSPTPTLIGGVGVLHARWAPVENHDPVTYAVHLSTASDFTPNGTTLLDSVSGGAFTIRTLTDGTALAYGTTYYCKVVASDVDGSAAASAAASGQMHQITGPDVSAEYVYAGTLNYGQMIGGPIDASGLLATTIKTAELGARVEITTSGMVVYNAAGQPVTELKGDGSLFRGIAALTSMTTSGQAVFGGPVRLDVGVTMTLSEGFGPPTNAPTWGESYDQVTLDNEEPWLGLASLDATHWVGMLDGQADGSGGYRIVKIDKTTGALTVLYDGSGYSSLNPNLGPLVSSTNIYGVQVGTTDELAIAAHDLVTGARVDAFTIPDELIPGDPTRQELHDAAFGWDAVDGKAMMLWPDRSAGQDRLAKFDPVSSGGTITNLNVAGGAGNPWTTVQRVGSNYVGTIAGSLNAFHYAVTDGARVRSAEWALTQPPQGFAHDGSNFWQLNVGALTKYEDDTGGGTWWADYEWYDSDPAGDGTHRSGTGFATTFFTPNRRAKVTLASDPIVGQGGVDEPDQARFFVGIAPPGEFPAEMWLQGATSEVGRTSETVVVPVTAGVARSTVNEFEGVPSATPACIVSNATDGTNPLIELCGDGYAWVKGTDDWKTITLINGCSAVVGATPQYRIDPVGNVHLRGHVAVNGNSSGVVAFILPVGYRPTAEHRYMCDAAGGGSPARVILHVDGDVRLHSTAGSPMPTGHFVIDESFTTY